MKMYNKKDLTYKNGLLISEDGDVIGIDNEIVDLANELETMVQKAEWLEEQPKPCAGPAFNEFTRKSEEDMEIDKFECVTPTLDKKTAESLKLMDELDLSSLCDDANEMLEGFRPLVMFVKDDSVISCEHAAIRRFDCPTLGNPLEWDVEIIQNAVALVHGVKKDNFIEIIDDDEQACDCDDDCDLCEYCKDSK